MIWVTGYLTLSGFLAAIVLWLLTTPNESCECGRCNEHVHILQNKISKLSLVNLVLFYTLFAVLAIPVLMFALVKDLFWSTSNE